MMSTGAALNHVGIGVPDIESAVAWYRDVLGCVVLLGPGVVSNDGTHLGTVAKDIYGDRFEGMRMAHLTTIDGLGIELFEFLDPALVVPDHTFEYWRTGIFHIALTVPNVEAVANRIAENGGRLLSKVWRLFENKEFEATYTQDPWGTVIELVSHPYSQFWANHEPPRPFPG
jgi:catechol 2,3-dioxygenase-like lactoylglutathione lyase family enzyme